MNKKNLGRDLNLGRHARSLINVGYESLSWQCFAQPNWGEYKYSPHFLLDFILSLFNPNGILLRIFKTIFRPHISSILCCLLPHRVEPAFKVSEKKLRSLLYIKWWWCYVKKSNKKSRDTEPHYSLPSFWVHFYDFSESHSIIPLADEEDFTAVTGINLCICNNNIAQISARVD